MNRRKRFIKHFSFAAGVLVISLEVPRFYDGNRFSGPLGSDRGISPFALDFGFARGKLGALFFNPAKRYAERLKINGAWSLRYVDYPFARPLVTSATINRRRASPRPS